MAKALTKNYKFDSLKLVSTMDVIDKEIAALSVNGGVYINNGVRIGASDTEIPGLLRFNGQFEGFDGNSWINLGGTHSMSLKSNNINKIDNNIGFSEKNIISISKDNEATENESYKDVSSYNKNKSHINNISNNALLDKNKNQYNQSLNEDSIEFTKPINLTPTSSYKYNYFGILDESLLDMVQSGIDPANPIKENNSWHSSNIFIMLVKKDIRSSYVGQLDGHVLIYDGVDWTDLGSYVSENIEKEDIINFTKSYLDNKFRQFSEYQMTYVNTYCSKILSQFIIENNILKNNANIIKKQISTPIELIADNFYPIDQLSLLLGNQGLYKCKIYININMELFNKDLSDSLEDLTDTIELKLIYGFSTKEFGLVNIDDCTVISHNKIELNKNKKTNQVIEWNGRINNDPSMSLNYVWIELWAKKINKLSKVMILPNISNIECEII